MRLRSRHRYFILAIFVVAAGASAQAAPCGSWRAVELLGAQATLIGQDLRRFPALYSGRMSLVDSGDHQLSQSYGVYTGACVTPKLSAYVDAEMIRGSGVSHASGLAAVTNGDVLRQGSVDLGNGPYVARAFVRWTQPLAAVERDTIARAMDEAPGVVSGRRVEITVGKFAATDVFDLNRYANSTRTQFLDWVLFNDGAWDYAADTRGYSNGVAVAWITRTWSLRAGSFQMPTFANGNRFDADVANARGDNLELTLSLPRDAMVRLLAFENHGRMGRYDVATDSALAHGATPDIVADDARGRIKRGVGLNAELPLSADGTTGVFARLGWNDGRTEDFVFTEVDSHVSGGVQIAGESWRRAADRLALGAASDGLSAPHRRYLAAGGSGFLLGDGALRYGRETLVEAYYLAQVLPLVALTADVMRIADPGYNRDRGPATVLSGRVNARW